MARHLLLLIVLFALAGCTPATLAPPPPNVAVDPYTGERAAMVHEQIAGRGVRNSAVLAALSKVERHRFVPEEYALGRLRGSPLAHRLRTDDLAAIHRRIDE